jgi:multimeric flavodoxin WrbA/putative sterol carrier protein
MTRFLRIMPPVILTAYITAGNMAVFRESAMQPLSLCGLILMGLVLYARRKKDGVTAIEKGFFLYMALNAVVFWGFPETLSPVIADFPTGVLYTVLFAVTAAPALLKKQYFTERFARRNTPEAVWETDIFKNINRDMSWAWAGLFALCAIVTAIPYLLSIPGSLFVGMFFQVVLPGLIMVGLGIPFNKMYPRYHQRKLGLEPVDVSTAGTTDTAAPSFLSEHPIAKENAMSEQLKVVIINGSPHGALGNTSLMIEMIASGLTAEGVILEQIMLTEKNIRYCIGCGACIEKSRCWQQDDHDEIVDKLLAADGIILASPVYFSHVTAQMKTFIDRSLRLGHKLRKTWKPGLAVSVSAGKAETLTAHYLARTLSIYGAFSLGTLTAMATSPGGFLGKELVEARAKDLAHDLARAIKEKRQYPATDEDLSHYLFMRELVTREKDFMRDDYGHWQEKGLLDGFESYVGQHFTAPGFDPEVRKEWLKDIVKAANAGKAATRSNAPTRPSGSPDFKTCRELIQAMPRVFRTEAAGEVSAVFQFVITGTEDFTAHLEIAGGRCEFHDGPSGKADVIITSPAEVWLAISRGELDGQTAFMSGKYKVQGNMALLLKMKELFAD